MLPANPTPAEGTATQPDAERLTRQGYRALEEWERTLLKRLIQNCNRLAGIGAAFWLSLILGDAFTIWNRGTDFETTIRLILSATLLAGPLVRAAPWLLGLVAALRFDLRNGEVRRVATETEAELDGQAVEILEHSGLIWNQRGRGPLPYGALSGFSLNLKGGNSVCATERTLNAAEQWRLKGRYLRELSLSALGVGLWVVLAVSPILTLALGRPVGLLLSREGFTYLVAFSFFNFTARVSWIEMFRLWGMRRDLKAGKTLVFHSREPGRRITRIEDVTHFEILPASGGEWLRRPTGNWDADPELPPLRAGQFDDDLVVRPANTE